MSHYPALKTAQNELLCMSSVLEEVAPYTISASATDAWGELRIHLSHCSVAANMAKKILTAIALKMVPVSGEPWIRPISILEILHEL